MRLRGVRRDQQIAAAVRHVRARLYRRPMGPRGMAVAHRSADQMAPVLEGCVMILFYLACATVAAPLGLKVLAVMGWLPDLSDRE